MWAYGKDMVKLSFCLFSKSPTSCLVTAQSWLVVIDDCSLQIVLISLFGALSLPSTTVITTAQQSTVTERQ
jgi:hypothetical protein